MTTCWCVTSHLMWISSDLPKPTQTRGIIMIEGSFIHPSRQCQVVKSLGSCYFRLFHTPIILPSRNRNLGVLLSHLKFFKLEYVLSSNLLTKSRKRCPCKLYSIEWNFILGAIAPTIANQELELTCQIDLYNCFVLGYIRKYFTGRQRKRCYYGGSRIRSMSDSSETYVQSVSCSKFR